MRVLILLRRDENLSPHHGCVTNWYQSMVTTLGLLGLMHESYENISGGI
jgi:hypothetical protein